MNLEKGPLDLPPQLLLAPTPESTAMAYKVVVCGPKGSGKSTIANFLAGHSEKLAVDKYDPTAGVRILEVSFAPPHTRPTLRLTAVARMQFETRIASSQKPVGVELWDASGDSSYDSCWKAIMSDADGVVLVYNPDAPSQDQQLTDWYEYFVKRNGLLDTQCVIFAHRGSPSASTSDKFRPPQLFSKVTAALTTSQSEADIRGMFEALVKDVHSFRKGASRK